MRRALFGPDLSVDTASEEQGGHSINPPDMLLSLARAFHRHRAQNHPERGCLLRRGNSCSVAINQQFLLLKEIILDGVKRFK